MLGKLKSPMIHSASGIPYARRALRGLLVVIASLSAGTPAIEAAEFEASDQAASVGQASALANVSVLANQRFSDEAGEAGLCDVYCPKSPPPESGHPAIVVVHGGAWISGDKWTLEGYSRNLAEHGFVAVTINYRLAPAHKFPAQVDDVRSAMLWAKQNAKQFEHRRQSPGDFWLLRRWTPLGFGRFVGR